VKQVHTKRSVELLNEMSMKESRKTTTTRRTRTRRIADFRIKSEERSRRLTFSIGKIDPFIQQE
jgi:hypothetical protein